jgi:hypothetical protein
MSSEWTEAGMDRLLFAVFAEPVQYDLAALVEAMDGAMLKRPVLKPREVDILNLHYERRITYVAIAKQYQLSSGRVLQIAWRAVARMRKAFKLLWAYTLDDQCHRRLFYSTMTPGTWASVSSHPHSWS